jgi:N-acetylglucosamine-6-phosphate deacetylase
MHPPSYIDLQVNGAFGVDFNDDALTFEAFHGACQRLQADGVVGFLPTIITDSIESMCRRIRKISEFAKQDKMLEECILGIHVEGPFISPVSGFVGTHPAQHVRPASLSIALQLIDAGQGSVRMLTLAPEQDESGEVTDRMRREKVAVFAGHTDASRSQLQRGIDSGLVGFTHLGNGCAMQVHRHDNIIQRVLSLRGQLAITLIADGVHVPGWLLKSWIDILGYENCIVISDAMSAAGMPPGEYRISGQPIQVDSDRRTRHREHGYLAGSASTMSDMDRWIHHHLSIDELRCKHLFQKNAIDLLGRIGA